MFQKKLVPTLESSVAKTIELIEKLKYDLDRPRLCLLTQQVSGYHLGKKKKVIYVRSKIWGAFAHEKRQNYGARHNYGAFLNKQLLTTLKSKKDPILTYIIKL
jgi:hypothetical protein